MDINLLCDRYCSLFISYQKTGGVEVDTDDDVGPKPPRDTSAPVADDDDEEQEEEEVSIMNT